MNAHRNLEVWQRAHALAIRVHRMTSGALLDRAPTIVDQVRRATESIPDNIAEGRAGRTDGVYLRHLGIALGSAAEADSQFVRLRDRGDWTPELAFELLEELAIVRRLLLALERSIKTRRQHPRRPATRRPLH
jgi:four helix bundle protein